MRLAGWSAAQSGQRHGGKRRVLLGFVSAAVAVFAPMAARRALCAVKGAPWPDVRLWVQQHPDGSASISKHRGPDSKLAFDAYSRFLPGTREVKVGDERFFAFQSPRLGAEQIVIWRKVQDVQMRAPLWLTNENLPNSALELRKKGVGVLDKDVPMRVTTVTERPQLTAAVWRWDNLEERDPARYWMEQGDDGPWMYWESFWAPAEEAKYAASKVAFGDAAGTVLRPLLNLDQFGNPLPTLGDGSRGALAETYKITKDEQLIERNEKSQMKGKAYGIVYEYNVWGSDVSRSGTGSDLWSPEARLAVTALEAVVDAFGIRSILDAACGDATWMVPYFVSRHPEIAYTGVDVVAEVVARNRQRHPGLQFVTVDLSEQPLPGGSQLIFSKETINHMHLNDAQLAIRRFVATGAKYLLTNVHEGADNMEGLKKTCHTTYIKYDYSAPPFELNRIARVVEYQGLNTSFTLYALQPTQQVVRVR